MMTRDQQKVFWAGSFINLHLVLGVLLRKATAAHFFLVGLHIYHVLALFGNPWEM